MSEHQAGDEPDVRQALLQQGVASREQSAATDALVQEIEWLSGAVRRRREELNRLQRRLRALEEQDQTAARLADLERQLADHRQEVDGLRAALEHAQREVSMLRRSWSWRLTAPLRAVYDRLRQRRSLGAAAAGGAAGEPPASSRPPGMTTDAR